MNKKKTVHGNILILKLLVALPSYVFLKNKKSYYAPKGQIELYKRVTNNLT